MKRKVVVTIHGIRTHGNWQKSITPYLARHDLIPYHLDYGFFLAFFFVVPWTRRRKVQWLRQELRKLCETARCSRLSVIAHSFGTYLIGQVLKDENGALRFDRIVLTGSIVRRDYPWHDFLAKRWVSAIRNERATKDWVSRLAGWTSRILPGFVALDAGPTGVERFMSSHANHFDYETGGGHSEVHNVVKFEQWARFIAFPDLPDDILGKVVAQLGFVRQWVAQKLKLKAELVRTNLFVPYDGKLRMPPGAWDNMTYAPELDIELETSHGCCGLAFTKGEVFIVWREAEAWSSGHLPESEMRKVNPRLKWVISVPVKKGEGPEVLGVVNVDGLDVVPDVLPELKEQQFEEFLVALTLVVRGKMVDYIELAYAGGLTYED